MNLERCTIIETFNEKNYIPMLRLWQTVMDESSKASLAKVVFPVPPSPRSTNMYLRFIVDRGRCSLLGRFAVAAPRIGVPGYEMIVLVVARFSSRSKLVQGRYHLSAQLLHSRTLALLELRQPQRLNSYSWPGGAEISATQHCITLSLLLDTGSIIISGQVNRQKWKDATETT